ncbi:unnamed protein product [Rotaria sp. Silwood1]|nr:unnamed protein product [Rotaria sp. Silwood1]CAF4898194.1 unnamed protein product [Rotaria sp. Silwood1]
MEMDKITKEYDNIRERIENYVQKFINEIEKQRDHALQIINERQHLNDEAFWTGNGFDNAKNITDKDLIELSDNLHTIPDVDEKLIELIQFSQLKLEFDELLPTKKFIHLSDFQEINNKDDKSINNNEENDCISP